MSFIEIHWQSEAKQVRQFGLLCIPAFPLAAWLSLASLPITAAFAGLGIVIATASLLAPQWIRPLFVGLMLITMPIAAVVRELMMLMIYGVVIVPIALCFRCLKRDRLQIRLAPNKQSFWQPKAKPKSIASYFHRF